jgi:hypothetical protein
MLRVARLLPVLVRRFSQVARAARVLVLRHAVAVAVVARQDLILASGLPAATPEH